MSPHRKPLLVASVLAALAAAAAAPAAAETMDELYAKAKPEGGLALYAAGPTEPHERNVKIFEQRFPGLKVSITGGFSNVLNPEDQQQLADKKVEADLRHLPDHPGLRRAGRQRGVLATFKPDGFDQVIRTTAIRTAPIWRSPPIRSPMPTTPSWCGPRTRRNRRSISSSRRSRAS